MFRRFIWSFLYPFLFETVKVLILTSDSIFSLHRKGELTPRYYNPGQIYKETHFVHFSGPRITTKALQSACGKAKLKIHTVPLALWRQRLMMVLPKVGSGQVLRRLVRLVHTHQISLIRCYGHRTNLILGAMLKEQTGTPLVASLHINPDLDIYQKETNLIKKLLLRLFDRQETRALRKCDLVLAVYQPIVSYLRKRNIRKYAVLHNVVQVA